MLRSPTSRIAAASSKGNCRWRSKYSHPIVLLLLLAGASGRALWADAARALPPGELPNDQRLQPLKDLDGYFPFTPPTSAADWSKRAEEVRRQMRVALGLWPAPPKTPLNAVIHGRIDREDYSVEKVYFESIPGFFVTGNLYRPKGKTGKLAGVLCPHGHWEHGRFMDSGANRVRQSIIEGGERFEEGGRSVLQSRCVQLARMGCVVFHYDMIGYADSQQLSLDLAHGFAKQRPEMNAAENWGLFSPQAEAHLQSVMGLQTWNSIRALDFLLSLSEVDSQRVAVTGASGGGTQTFILCGLDPRPAVAFPAVMVSTAMQGGCTCENASLLRVETGNVEFAALFAPKPLGMTAANDWTKEMPSKGFPELKRQYALLGAPNNVMLKPLLHFDHNYNYVSRAAMYAWLNRHLQLGLTEPILEENYQRLSQSEMSVWDDQHPAPKGGPNFERELLRGLAADAERQLQQASESPAEFRKLAGIGVQAVIGRNLAQAGEIRWVEKSSQDRGPFFQRTGLLRNSNYAEEVPVIFLEPKQRKSTTVIWADAAGKAGLFISPGTENIPKPEIEALLNSGAVVVGIDLLYQGESLQDGKPLTQTPVVNNPREAGAYTFGYNRAVFVQRVHDLLGVIRYIQQQTPRPARIDLAGLNGTGPLVAAARAQAGDAIYQTAVDTQGFRFGHVQDLHDPNFLPGGAKYGDLPGMLALTAPGKLWIAGEEGKVPELVMKVYAQAGAPDQAVAAKAASSEVASAAVAWMTSNP